jgi:Caspase domain
MSTPFSLFSKILLCFITSIVSDHIEANNPVPSKVKFESTIDLQKVKMTNKVVTLKAVMVICDHYKSPENNGIAQSVRVDMGTLTQMLNILQNRKIVQVERIVLQGNKATLANIQNTLKTVSAGPDDIVLFYFSGHGGMENGKTFIYTADEKNMYRADIEKMISSTSARLKMIITDACSNAINGLTATRSLSKTNQDIDAGIFDETYKELFLGYQGMMHLSSSTEGEFAWSNDNFGGFFTYHFIKEGIIKKPVKDWGAIFGTAKDKTSQMFMRLPLEDRSELAKEGVKNQTPKAFSMPNVYFGTIEKPEIIPPANTPNNTTDTYPPNTIPGKINLYNYTKKPVYFYIDNNDPSAEWLASNTVQKKVNAGKKITINSGAALVGYAYKGDDFYFELEDGNYFFAFDENRTLNLFYKEDDITINNYNSVVEIDYTKLMYGNWEWDDGQSGETVITSFDRKNFTEIYQQSNAEISGDWSIRKEILDGTEYNLLTFFYEIEDGSIYELDYIIMYDNEYPDEIQLVFLLAYENDIEISYEEAEEFLEPTIIMYRTE